MLTTMRKTSALVTRCATEGYRWDAQVAARFPFARFLEPAFATPQSSPPCALRKATYEKHLASLVQNVQLLADQGCFGLTTATLHNG